MPGRSKTSRRLNAMLLVAALALVQACTGFTPALADVKNMPAATAADGCCAGTPEPNCANAQDRIGAFGACAPYCLLGQDAAKSDSALPASAAITHASLSPIGWVEFPSQSPRPSAAARHANSVPLIYQFQRLLI